MPLTKQTTAAKKSSFLHHLEKTGIISEAARRMGIDRNVYYRWMENDPEFPVLAKKAFETYKEQLEAEADRRGVEGVDEPIYQGGKLIYVRGNRFSIGGQYEFGEKTFDTSDYKLNKGDKIYMYTDGYSDQFGGPEGKKFKTGNIRSMLQGIHEKPMDEQYNHIKSTFELWKGDLGQVDDVLFMGIEI